MRGKGLLLPAQGRVSMFVFLSWGLKCFSQDVAMKRRGFGREIWVAYGEMRSFGVCTRCRTNVALLCRIVVAVLLNWVSVFTVLYYK